MKRLIGAIAIFSLICSLSACSFEPNVTVANDYQSFSSEVSSPLEPLPFEILQGASSLPSSSSSTPSAAPEKEPSPLSAKKELRAVWLSFIELNFEGKGEAEFKSYIDEYFDKIKDMGANAVICHTVANCDAAYKSSLLPFSGAYSGEQGVYAGYDPLRYMVSAAKERKLEIHAWINPYRVSSKSKSIKRLSPQSPARKWLEDDTEKNDTNVLFTESGIYLNPAKEEVRQLIRNVIKEILDNYDIDGIQFDDYFYPTTAASFDEKSYLDYKSGRQSFLPLDEWRRTNVNLLISSVYSLVHRYDGRVFGISPAANISADKRDKNFSEFYADIYSWMEIKGYIDYIAPQLYFGYNYPEEDFSFGKLLKAWCDAKRHSSLKLYIGLAPYKIGQPDGTSEEWIKEKGIIARQISDLRRSKADGFMLYSCSYLFSQEEKNIEELKQIKKVLK